MDYWAEWIVLSRLIDSYFQMEKTETITRFKIINLPTRALISKISQVGYCQNADAVYFSSPIIVSWNFEGCK